MRPSVGTPLANTTRCSECTLKKSSVTSTSFVHTSSASSGGMTTALRGVGGGPGITGPPGPITAPSGIKANGFGWTAFDWGPIGAGRIIGAACGGGNCPCAAAHVPADRVAISITMANGRRIQDSRRGGGSSRNVGDRSRAVQARETGRFHRRNQFVVASVPQARTVGPALP